MGLALSVLIRISSRFEMPSKFDLPVMYSCFVDGNGSVCAELGMKKTACRSGFIQACYELSGEHPDGKSYAYWQGVACDQGDVAACSSQKRSILNIDVEKGLSLIEAGCEKSVVSDCVQYALTLKQLGRADSIILEAYKKSCNLGDRVSCQHAGIYMWKVGRISEGDQFFKKFCNNRSLDNRDRCLTLAGSLWDSGRTKESSSMFAELCEIDRERSACQRLRNLFYENKNLTEEYRFQRILCFEHNSECRIFILNTLKQNDSLARTETLKAISHKFCGNEDFLQCKNIVEQFVRSGRRDLIEQAAHDRCQRDKTTCEQYARTLLDYGKRKQAAAVFDRSCKENLGACLSLLAMSPEKFNRARLQAVGAHYCGKGEEAVVDWQKCQRFVELATRYKKIQLPELLQVACDGGMPLSCDDLGELYKAQRKFSLAEKYFTQGCNYIKSRQNGDPNGFGLSSRSSRWQQHVNSCVRLYGLKNGKLPVQKIEVDKISGPDTVAILTVKPDVSVELRTSIDRRKDPLVRAQIDCKIEAISLQFWAHFVIEPDGSVAAIEVEKSASSSLKDSQQDPIFRKIECIEKYLKTATFLKQDIKRPYKVSVFYRLQNLKYRSSWEIK